MYDKLFLINAMLNGDDGNMQLIQYSKTRMSL